MNIVAPRCKLAMDNLTRNLAPKLMTIKTVVSFFFFFENASLHSFMRVQITGYMQMALQLHRW